MFAIKGLDALQHTNAALSKRGATVANGKPLVHEVFIKTTKIFHHPGVDLGAKDALGAVGSARRPLAELSGVKRYHKGAEPVQMSTGTGRQAKSLL